MEPSSPQEAAAASSRPRVCRHSGWFIGEGVVADVRPAAASKAKVVCRCILTGGRLVGLNSCFPVFDLLTLHRSARLRAWLRSPFPFVFNQAFNRIAPSRVPSCARHDDLGCCGRIII